MCEKETNNAYQKLIIVAQLVLKLFSRNYNRFAYNSLIYIRIYVVTVHRDSTVRSLLYEMDHCRVNEHIPYHCVVAFHRLSYTVL